MSQDVESSAESVADRLIWVREFFDLKQKDFAKSIDVSQAQLSNWERAMNRMSLEGALKIRKVYGVSLDFLFLARAETLPQTMHKAWLERSRVKNSNISSD